MRHLALVKLASLAMLSIGTMAAAAPAHAQAYDPNYPVCMQVYGPLSRTECRYFSIPQCQASASGRSARCEINPFLPMPLASRSKRRSLGIIGVIATLTERR
jgi:hypothetical protein